MAEQIKGPYTFQLETRTPKELPPPGSCDAQFHVYGDPAVYPMVPKPLYQPPPAGTIENAIRMHRALGFERGVIVHPSVYGGDHRLLLDCLSQYKNYRGTALVDERISDAELRRLHEAGVRGARFNFSRQWGEVMEPAPFERIADRLGALGWHVKVRTKGAEILEHEALFRRLEIPVVIDHLGHLDASLGADQPAVRFIEDLLAKQTWWIKLSNADRFSKTGYPWDDAVPIARRFIAVAPDHVIWGTDWPHVNYSKPVPNDADLFELLLRYAPDPVLRRKILVDNPARLYDFP
jgi:predicted TIM-barrel fold metal-dependent hydrolase